MQNTTHINDYVGSLPKMVQAWAVYYKGKRHGTVRSYSKNQAYGYICSVKYPERDQIVLEYIGLVK